MYPASPTVLVMFLGTLWNFGLGILNLGSRLMTMLYEIIGSLTVAM